MNLLITGADGFVSSHLTESLVRQGHSVRAFALSNSFNSWGWLDYAPRDIHDNLDLGGGTDVSYRFWEYYSRSSGSATTASNISSASR